MFPGAHARIDRNEAGEVTGWDYPSHDDPYDDSMSEDSYHDYDPDYDDTRYDRDTDENYAPDEHLDAEYESRFEIDES